MQTISKLDEAFIKPTNIIYNKHLLITSKQEQMHSIDSYMQGLEKLAQGCKFEAIDARQNKEQYMRDAFINGISSACIRQRLLENWELMRVYKPEHLNRPQSNPLHITAII